MCEQRIDRTVLSCQFRLAKQGVNLTMAYPVQVLGMPAAFGLRNQVVRISLAARNLPFTQWTHHDLRHNWRIVLLQ